MVVSMTDEERQTLNVILTALETLPAERVAYAQGYLQAMADLPRKRNSGPPDGRAGHPAKEEINET